MSAADVVASIGWSLWAFGVQVAPVDLLGCSAEGGVVADELTLLARASDREGAVAEGPISADEADEAVGAVVLGDHAPETGGVFYCGEEWVPVVQGVLRVVMVEQPALRSPILRRDC